MKKDEVYCKNCKNFYKEIYIGHSITRVNYKCYIDLNEKDYKGEKLYKVNDCKDKNIDKNCQDYKQKWYIFWI